ncbi:hypothetical protein SB861_36935 [Paraburkholderia sp. SIMBA_049]
MAFHHDLALFYLARKAEGIHSFRRFADSYRAHAAGCPHQLVIVYKGFEGCDDRDLDEARNVFREVDDSHNEVCVSDEHYDIGAYIQAAHQIDAKFVCFVNTHTEILADSWLKHLRDAIEDESVGIAGATGSYESLYDSLALLDRVIWLAGFERVAYDRKLADYYRFILNIHAPWWLAEKPQKEREYGHFYERYLDEKWKISWRNAVSPGGYNDFLEDFPRFPNPHVRSNGFILRRSDFLKFSVQPTKKSAFGFESGPNGLSQTLLKEGKRLLMVDRDGRCVDQGDWPHAHCFRSGNQEKLLLADNQTRAYDRLSQAEKVTHLMLSWGDAVAESEAAYSLGYRFEMTRATRPAHYTTEVPYIADHADYGVQSQGVCDGAIDPYLRDDKQWPHNHTAFI